MSQAQAKHKHVSKTLYTQDSVTHTRSKPSNPENARKHSAQPKYGLNLNSLENEWLNIDRQINKNSKTNPHKASKPSTANNTMTLGRGTKTSKPQKVNR